jgi:hypothetical protein
LIPPRKQLDLIIRTTIIQDHFSLKNWFVLSSFQGHLSELQLRLGFDTDALRFRGGPTGGRADIIADNTRGEGLKPVLNQIGQLWNRFRTVDMSSVDIAGVSTELLAAAAI